VYGPRLLYKSGRPSRLDKTKGQDVFHVSAEGSQSSSTDLHNEEMVKTRWRVDVPSTDSRDKLWLDTVIPWRPNKRSPNENTITSYWARYIQKSRSSLVLVLSPSRFLIPHWNQRCVVWETAKIASVPIKPDRRLPMFLFAPLFTSRSAGCPPARTTFVSCWTSRPSVSPMQGQAAI
jgi:hypothetical protein